MSVEGNKNAEKYTADDIVALCNDACDLLLTPENGIHYITHALNSLGIYSTLLDSWEKTHSKNSSVLGSIKKVKGIGRDCLVSNGLTGATNPSMSMFILKASHGMVEKGVELEVTGKKNLVQIEMVKATK